MIINSRGAGIVKLGKRSPPTIFSSFTHAIAVFKRFLLKFHWASLNVTWVWFQPGVMWMVLSLRGFCVPGFPPFSKTKIFQIPGQSGSRTHMALLSKHSNLFFLHISFTMILLMSVVALFLVHLSHVLFSCYFCWFFHSYDLILLADPQEFLKKFLEFNANMVFSAEGFCWPDRGLKVSATVILPNLLRTAAVWSVGQTSPHPNPGQAPYLSLPVRIMDDTSDWTNNSIFPFLTFINNIIHINFGLLHDYNLWLQKMSIPLTEGFFVWNPHPPGNSSLAS